MKTTYGSYFTQNYDVEKDGDINGISVFQVRDKNDLNVLDRALYQTTRVPFWSNRISRYGRRYYQTKKQAPLPNDPVLTPNSIIHAYKFTNSQGWSPFRGPNHGGFVYEPQTYYIEKDFSGNRAFDCAKGLNVATYDWCIHANDWCIHAKKSKKLFLVEFRLKDIVSIPYNTSGKFRVKHLFVVGECKWEDGDLFSKYSRIKGLHRFSPFS